MTKLRRRLSQSSWRAGWIAEAVFYPPSTHVVADELALLAHMFEAPAMRLASGLSVSHAPFVARRSSSPRKRRATLRLSASTAARANGALLADLAIDELELAHQASISYATWFARLKKLTVSWDHGVTAESTLRGGILRELVELDVDARSADRLLPLLVDGTRTPKLATLRLHDPFCDHSVETIATLRTSPLLKRLSALYLG